MHFPLFLLLGFTLSGSAQLVDLPAKDPSIASTNNAEIGFDSTGDGVGGYDFRSDSPEALIMSQKDDNQPCSSNGNNQRPQKGRLRARDWCLKDQYELAPENPPSTDIKPPPSPFLDGEPKEGSAAGGNPTQAGAEQYRTGKPRTSKPPELPTIPGRTPSSQEKDDDPCTGEKTYAVCSPLEPTTPWFPLSLIWATGSLEYCRLCTSSCFFFCLFVCLWVVKLAERLFYNFK